MVQKRLEENYDYNCRQRSFTPLAMPLKASPLMAFQVYSFGHSMVLLRRRFSLPVSLFKTNDTLNLHGIRLCPTLILIIKLSFLKCTI
jgi:hypothetical protein